MEYVAEIQADLNGYPSSEKLILKQGDEGMRYVIVALLNNGVPVSIGADVTPRVAMTKPDGKQILTDDNIEVLEDGTLKIKVIAQMTVAAGPGIMEIGLYKQGAHLSTAVLGVYVYPNALSMIKVASSNEYQALIDALGQVAPAIDAEKERLISEDERRASEAERKENEIIRQAALERCIEASAHAEAQGNYAKNQGDYAKDRGKYAEQQAENAVNEINTNMTKIQSDFNNIKDIITSLDNGELLLRVEELLNDMYRLATEWDIDSIIAGTYADEDEQGSIFETGTTQDIDEIISGEYVDNPEEDGIDDKEIHALVDGLFK